jgi:hypothetical protein
MILCLAGLAAVRCAPPSGKPVAPSDPLADMPAPASAKVDAARRGVQAYAAEMKLALTGAIEKGGATLAIEVCKSEAPRLAREHGARIGGRIGRTSLGLRNPENEPDEWEIARLEKFAQLIRAGRDPSALEFASVEKSDGNKEVLRYAKPIPMDTLCLTCHGETIAPPIQAKLDALYPEDKGKGFKAADLRGMFTVTLPMDAP